MRQQELKEKITGRINQVEAILKKRSSLLLAGLTLLLCASILIGQFTRIQRTQADSLDLVTEFADLQQQTREAQLRYAALQDENQQLKADRSAAINEFLSSNPLAGVDMSELQAELSFVRVMSGSTAISGQGVTLLLSDPEGIDYATATAQDIIHEQDVMNAVNLLKSNGAVAMAVNGERLTASSRLICNGPTILVNRTLLSAPFVITAVGDSDQMMDAMRADNNINYLIQTGKRVEISSSIEMTIPALNDQIMIDQALEMMKEVLES